MLLTLLPIVGPIIQGIVDAFNKYQDVSLQKQVDKNKTALGKQESTDNTDVSIIQARTEVAIAFKDDIGTRLIRDLVMFPVATWTACYYYTLMVPDYSWKVLTPPESMQYIPYAVIAFLFVTAYRGR